MTTRDEIKKLVNATTKRYLNSFPAAAGYLHIPITPQPLFITKEQLRPHLEATQHFVDAIQKKNFNPITITEDDLIKYRGYPSKHWPSDSTWIIYPLRFAHEYTAILKHLIPHIHAYGGLLFFASPHKFSDILHKYGTNSQFNPRLYRRFNELTGERERLTPPPATLNDSYTHTPAALNEINQCLKSLNTRVTPALLFQISRFYPIKYTLNRENWKLKSINWSFVNPKQLTELAMRLTFLKENPQLQLENFRCSLDNYTPQNQAQNNLLSAAKAIVSGDFRGPHIFFVHGAAGNGKTHILVAIALALYEQKKRIHYVTSDLFQKENAYKLTPCDVIILDDFNCPHTGGSQNFLFKAMTLIKESGGILIISSNQKAFYDITHDVVYERNKPFADTIPRTEIRLTQPTNIEKLTNEYPRTTQTHQHRVFSPPPKSIDTNPLLLGLGITGGIITATLAPVVCTTLYNGLLAGEAGPIFTAVLTGLLAIAAITCLRKAAEAGCKQQRPSP